MARPKYVPIRLCDDQSSGQFRTNHLVEVNYQRVYFDPMSESTLLYILVTSSSSPHTHEAVPQKYWHGLGPRSNDLADGHIFLDLHLSTPPE